MTTVVIDVVMELPTETITHNDTEYTISFRWVIECSNCEYLTRTTSRADRISCGKCKHKNPRDNIVGKYFDTYLKYALFNGNEESTDDAINRLQYFADKLDAMQNNGWEFDCTTGSSHIALHTGDIPPQEIHA